MRLPIFLGALAITAMASTGSAQAQEPWCSVDDQTNVSCLYYTFEQCQEAISGVGGYCQRNPRYGSNRQPRRSYRSRDYDDRYNDNDYSDDSGSGHYN